jgi:purine-binding chemotaxis protein CheW
MSVQALNLDAFETPPLSGTAIRQYVTFTCVGQVFGVDIMAMREIRNWSPVTPLPGQKPDVLGIIEIRGRVIPVHDLALRIGCTTERKTQHEGQVILVLVIDGRDMGLLVDAVSDIIEVDAESLLPVPQIEGSAARFLGGIARHDDELVAILDEIAVQQYAVDMGEVEADKDGDAAPDSAEMVFLDEIALSSQT